MKTFPRDKWVEFDTYALLEAPKLPACYAIYMDDRLRYIGSTDRFRVRMQSHLKVTGYSGWSTTPWGQFKSVKVKAKFPSRYGDWLTLEARLLRRLRPEFNKKGFGNNFLITPAVMK